MIIPGGTTPTEFPDYGVVTKSADYQILTDDDLVVCDANIQVLLPVVPRVGKPITIKLTNNASAVDVYSNYSDIDNSGHFSLVGNYAFATFAHDGTRWRRIG